MALELVGTLPVSGANVGLAASVGGLTAKVNKLTADLSGLNGAILSEIELTASFPPNPSFLAAFAAAADPTVYALETAWLPSGSLTVNADLVIDLGIIDAQLAIVTPLAADLEMGLDVPGIAGWSYSGSAVGFGRTMQAATANGFATIGPDVQISATIIATESFSSWGSMSQSFDVGDSATVPADPANDHLQFLGMRAGSNWNTGCAQLRILLDAFLGELRGTKSQIENSMQVCLGFDLPDPTLVIDTALSIIADVGIDGLLDNLVNVHADLSGSVTWLQADIDAAVALAAQLNAQLSAGGLCCWRYSGTARGLGEALQIATANGIPGGTGPNTGAYGLVIASTPSNMNAFGSIFLI